jgi:hypothetical protein
MASFYNNYYRYHRPYSPENFLNASGNFKPSPTKDKFSSNTSSHEENKDESFEKKEKSSRYYSFGPINFKNPLFQNIEEPIFEIFSIKLYLDDIIILGLLIFLYQEGVQDEMLFISLILLLIA